MKVLLAVALLFVTFSRPALADHIGIYRDSSAQSCILAPGLNSTAVVIHRFSTGATGSQFRVDFSHAPGSTFLSFDTPFTPVGSLTSGIAIGYGQCLVGNLVLGTITATLISGYLGVAPEAGYSAIIYSGCDATDYPATGGIAYIGGDSECSGFDATEPSTWGRVKALYRE
jgi:hypothetical protein